MSERMTIECACERGGDCTSISACSADSMLQDQDEELQHKLASLTGEVDMWRKQVTELEAENTRLRKQSVRIYNSGYMSGHHDTVESCFVDIYLVDMDTYQDDVVSELLAELEECEG